MKALALISIIAMLSLGCATSGTAFITHKGKDTEITVNSTEAYAAKVEYYPDGSVKSLDVKREKSQPENILGAIGQIVSGIGGVVRAIIP